MKQASQFGSLRAHAAAQHGYVATLALLLTACEILTGYDPFYPPERDAGSGDTGSPRCSVRPPAELRGPELVAHEVNGHCFWIDRAEVTRADYARFLREVPRGSTDETPCDENATIEPAPVDGTGERCTAGGILVSSDANHPIVCVDWCDARAYCRWAGKALCRDQYVSPNLLQNDWYAACANGARRTIYPYGSTHHEALCNGSRQSDTGCESGACTTVAAESLPSCSSELGVRHLSGNVAEWTEACLDVTGPADDCRVRGGSFQSGATGLACDAAYAYRRGTHHAAVGFRCCWYPK